MKSNYQYLPADKYVVLNDNDPDLRPIILSLPKPPPLHTIAGYGLPPEQQRFERVSIPKRLIDLEAEAVQKTKEKLSTNVNNVVTLLKIQKTFWDLLYSRYKDYKKEIEFIRRMWYHRMNGYWFFNFGKPTYITGRHFYYLNYWTMDTNEGENRPQYRDRDRKEYIFKEYCWTSNETFKHLDSEGFAIKGEDGKYEMIDIKDNHGKPIRICLGYVQPKNRRSGNTNKALCDGLEVLTRTIGTDGLGVQSYSNDNAEEHFKMKLMPAYDKLPLWNKPLTSSGRTSDTLKFDVGKNEYGEETLETKATYATTSSPSFYDGKKLIYILVDECGKTPSSVCSVLKRHEVTRHVLAQGNGRLIHGMCSLPSTSDEMADGAFEYRFLASTSNFYQRVRATGQTFSGMFRLFVSATEGLDGFIDSYGYSVKDKILPHQSAEGFSQTALDYLQGNRDALLAKGDTEAMRSYREQKKLFPIRYADCWLGEAGDIGFNYEIIDSRLAELRRHDDTVRGNLEWKDGYGGDVIFIADEENGRFSIAKHPNVGVANKKIQIMAFSSFEGKDIMQYRPMFPTKFVLGCDPFKFSNTRDVKGNIAAKGSRSNLSDGGIAIIERYDASVDGAKPITAWDTYKFVLSYRYKPASIDEFNEDVLKAAIYYGAMVYPEVNIPTTWEYFVKQGFAGYLLYDIDIKTGRYKERPGQDSLERSKQAMFAKVRDYIQYRGHVEPFAKFLQECKDIKAMDDMRHYDRFVAHGVALMGCETPFAEEAYGGNMDSFDLEDYLNFS